MAQAPGTHRVYIDNALALTYASVIIITSEGLVSQGDALESWTYSGEGNFLGLTYNGINYFQGEIFQLPTDDTTNIYLTTIIEQPIYILRKNLGKNITPNNSDAYSAHFNFSLLIPIETLRENFVPLLMYEDPIFYFFDWQDFIDKLPSWLEYFGATDVSSTLTLSGDTKADITGFCIDNDNSAMVEFYRNDEDGYYFSTPNGYDLDFSALGLSGSITFTIDGQQGELTSIEQLEEMFSSLTANPLFDTPSIIIYEYDTTTNIPVWKTRRQITILGGTDIRNPVLLSWFKRNSLPKDLSYTYWKINDTPTLSNIGTKNINFTSNNTEYDSITINNSSLNYNNTTVYLNIPGGGAN